MSESPSFVSVPFETDPDALADDAIDYLRDAIPGWEPADGNLEVWLVAALARIAAEVTTVAATVPVAALRAFGTQLVGIPQLDGELATLVTLWTARDTLGHTIPAGTQVGYRVSGDTLIVFEVTADTVLAPGGPTLGGVVLSAVDVGVAWNGVPVGPLELIDALSWVDSVQATSTSSGGIDAETDDAFTTRLVSELRLLAPRPILPDDFSTLARRVEGVARALTVDGYDPGVNEIQQVAITGAPTGGTLTLAFGGNTTTAIARNATASAVQSALEALASIGVGQVSVTGGPLPGTPVLVEFTGTLGSTNVPAMTSTDSLTGGTTPASAITTTRSGIAPSAGNQRMVTVVPLTAAGTAPASSVRSTVRDYLDSLREVSFAVNVSTPTTTTVNVTFSVHVLTGFDAPTVVTAAQTAVAAYLSPATWAGGADSPPTWRPGENKVRYLAVSTVIANTPGVGYVSALTLNSGTADVTLAGIAPLPSPGTITGTSA